MPSAGRLPHAVIPLGFEPADFEAVACAPAGGRRLRSGRRPGAPLLRRHAAAHRPRDAAPAARAASRARAATIRPPARVRLHFFGTSNQSSSERVSRPAVRARVRRRRRGDGVAWTARLSRRAVGADARVARFCCSAAPSGTTRRASSIRRCWRSGRSSRCSTRRAASCRSSATPGPSRPSAS